MRGIILAAALLASAPSEAAACHRFSVWHYKFPQRCHASATRALWSAPVRAVAIPQPPAPVAPPPPSEDEGRARALDAMKPQLLLLEAGHDY